MSDDDDKRLAGWIWGILCIPIAIMALGAFAEGLASGSVDNLMARGEPSPEEFEYDQRPIAYISMLGMWCLLFVLNVWLFWKIWLSDSD